MTTCMIRNSSVNQTELSRLLTAAVINQRFRTLLLTNPANALDYGFHGEPFRLEKVEKDRILAIRAGSLADFARQLTGELDYPIPLSRCYLRI